MPPTAQQAIKEMIVPSQGHQEHIQKFHVPSFQNLIFHVELSSLVPSTFLLSFDKYRFLLELRILQNISQFEN